MPYKNPSPQPTAAAVLGFPHRFYRSTASHVGMWWDDIHDTHLIGNQDESLQVTSLVRTVVARTTDIDHSEPAAGAWE